MKLKVHVAADQLTQWWDGYICGKSEKLETIIQSNRYYLAMLFLESEGFLVRKDEFGNDVDPRQPVVEVELALLLKMLVERHLQAR